MSGLQWFLTGCIGVTVLCLVVAVVVSAVREARRPAAVPIVWWSAQQ